MFGRRSKADSPGPDPSVYDGLRTMLLTLDPSSAGIGPTPDLPDVWGCVMDMRYAEGAVTVVGLADGTTSMYTSGGGGIIGAGEHESVATMTRRWLHTAQQTRSAFGPDVDQALPAAGWVTLRLLTFAGRLQATGPEEEFGYGRHPAAAVFHAGHGVITAVRELEEGN